MVFSSRVRGLFVVVVAVCAAVLQGGLMPRLQIMEAGSTQPAQTGPNTSIALATPVAGTVIPGVFAQDAAGGFWVYPAYRWGTLRNVSVAVRFGTDGVISQVGFCVYGGGMRVPPADMAMHCELTSAGVYLFQDAYFPFNTASAYYPKGTTVSWKFLVFWEWQAD